MREVITDIDQWLTEGEAIALATVVETWGSAPRQAGAKMALTAGGRISGSVSGGCVEGAVVEAGTETLDSGRPQLLSFGVADETAWEVGLACGGQIEVFVERLDPAVYQETHRLIDAEETAAVATVIAGPDDLLGSKWVVGREGIRAGSAAETLAERVTAVAQAALAAGESRRTRLDSAAGPIELFIELLLPAPTLVIVGGVHIAIALAALARPLGYRTIVIDPRRAFGSQERFPHADRLIQAWPDKALAGIKLNETTAVAMLTHDPKIDDPALKIVLPSPAFYVGALGSSQTHARRRRRLMDAGLAESLVDRIHSPIGLDINAQTPEEIALAVMGEVVAARRGRPNRTISDKF